MNENWSNAEKRHARRVYDGAVQRELAEILAEFKARAASAQTPGDMWSLESYLREARNEFDRKYDYRYSQLIPVFGQLLYEERITADELLGLREDKREAILQDAQLLSRLSDRRRKGPGRKSP